MTGTRQDVSKAYCAACGTTVSREFRRGPDGRPNASCPRCGSLERHLFLSLLLGVLVAVAGGVVLASVAGARRTGTVAERLRSASLPADVAALPNEPGFDWDAVRAVPDVDIVGEFAVTTFAVVGYGQAWVDEGALSTFPPASPEMTVEIAIVSANCL